MTGSEDQSAVPRIDTITAKTGGARPNRQQGSAAPLVSVLAVVFNDRHELAALIENIAPFRSGDLEFIIVDGASSDGTLELLQRCDHHIDYWISEADHGIYDAMNKGVAACTGEYILHLNAGDRLLQIPWELLRRCKSSRIDVVSCRVLIDNEIQFLPRTGLISKIDNAWHHQGTFYLSATHQRYDSTYRICGDFDLNQRLFKSGCKVHIDSSIVSNHKSGGISTNADARREIFRSVRTNYGPLYLILSCIRFGLIDFRRWLARGVA